MFFSNKTFETHYIVKEEEGVVVCIIYDCEFNAMSLVNKHTGLFELSPDPRYVLGEYRGVAKCLPEDTFDVEYGKKLAYKKAYAKYTSALEKTVKRIVKDFTEASDELLKGLNKAKSRIDGKTLVAIEACNKLLNEQE